MAITISQAKEVPELKYENFFLEDLRLTQRFELDNEAAPYYVLIVFYRLFAVDAYNVRHFDPKGRYSFTIEDYAKVAYIKKMMGDPDLINAMGAIEVALAKIITDQVEELGEATVIT